jgi:hypothetical protein
MDPKQAFELEQVQRRVDASDAELLKLAREVAHSDTLQSLAELTWTEAQELIGVLDTFERARVRSEFSRREAELVAR